MSNQTRSDREKALIETARRVLPAGTFGNTSLDIVIHEGYAGRVRDVSGNEYVDYLLGSGPMLVGHAHPEVVAAVQEQVPLGTTFFVNNEHGIELAAAIVDAVPCAEQVRFVSSGSEADLYAMRLARAFRKRDKILKFEGGYHGMSDYGLMSLSPKRPGNFPQAVPDSAGIPESVRGEMLIAPFNDTAMAESLIREHRDELAGVIVEPFQRLIPPKPGFLEALREMTARHNIPLIFDEVVTGFRFAYGGAQEYYGVTPDICTLGKVIGGGFPLAAIAGREDIMSLFDRGKVGDDRFLTQIGTLSGNPIAATAGLKTLEILRRPGAYETIFRNGRALMEGYRDIIHNAGVAARVAGDAPMFDVVFTDRDVTDYRGMLGDADKSKLCNRILRERGIFKSESKHYVSLAHTDDDIRRTLDAFASSIVEVTRMRAA